MAAVLLRPDIVFMKIRDCRLKEAVPSATALVRIALPRTDAIIIDFIEGPVEEYPEPNAGLGVNLAVFLRTDNDADHAVRVDAVL